MNRRTFVILAGVTIGSSVIPAGIYFIKTDVKKFAALILRRELFYLKLETSGVDIFINDYFNAIGNNMLSKLKWIVLYHSRKNWQDSDSIRDLIKYYLLSSDFFINRTDESKIVNYLGLFNSYLSPIPNPYSFVLYPPSDIPDP